MEYKKFKYKDYKNCYFIVGSYANNPLSIYISIENDEEGSIADVTVNKRDYFYLPGTATIKNYSENAKMTKFLQKLGIIEEVYSSVKCNPFATKNETIDFCQINMENLKKYSRQFNYEY